MKSIIFDQLAEYKRHRAKTLTLNRASLCSLWNVFAHPPDYAMNWIDVLCCKNETKEHFLQAMRHLTYHLF